MDALDPEPEPKYRMLPFTQYLLPDGRIREIRMPCPPEAEGDARTLLAVGARFEAEILSTGHVSLTVEHPAWEADDRGPVAIELCTNDPAANRVALVALFKSARANLQANP